MISFPGRETPCPSSARTAPTTPNTPASVWAAKARDAGGAHAEDAALLCRLLDLHAYMSERARRPDSAANLADGLLSAILSVRQRLADAG